MFQKKFDIRNKKQISYYLVAIIFITFPFNSVIIDYWLIAKGINISSWKNIYLILFLIISFSSLKIAKKYIYLYVFILSFIGILLIHLITNISAGSIGAFRNYVFPLLILISILNLKLTILEITSLKKIITTTAILSCAFAFYQAYVLKDIFLIEIGFPTSQWNSNKLDFAFYISNSDIQRLNGGFVAPVPFATFLLLVYILNETLNKLINRIILLSILLSMVRSAIIAAIIYLITKKGLITKSATTIYSGLSLILIYIVQHLYFNDLIIDLIEIMIGNTVGEDDSSKQGHIESFRYGFSLLKENLIGTGLGTVGPSSDLYFGNKTLIESLHLSLGVELGLLPLIFYIGINIFILLSCRFSKKIVSLLLAYQFIGIFLPIQYYFELNILYYLILGLMIIEINNK